MRHAVCAGALLLLVLAGTSGQAGQKTYAGEEAAALRCANTLAFTAVALESSGGISTLEKDIMLGITVRILAHHVSGTWRQKKAALGVMRDRRDVIETFDDFQRFANQCLVQFPVG